MDTEIPIIVPIDSSPSTCPECGKVEDIKRVCRHCGYEYKDCDPTTFRDWLGVFVVVVVIWAGITVLIWLLQTGTERYPATLVRCFECQWEFIKSLKVW
jgi:hypothetical protein